MGESAVEAFLAHLSVIRRVAESTQNHALETILFLYRHVLARNLSSLDAVLANRPRHPSTVFSTKEVRRMIAEQPPKVAMGFEALHLMSCQDVGSNLSRNQINKRFPLNGLFEMQL
jgi:hypothetical protein